MTIKFSNNATATLGASLTSIATSITLTTGQGALFPSLGAGDYFFATIVNASNLSEVVKVTARVVDVLTVQRAVEGTTALAFGVGDKVELRVTAQGLNDILSTSLTSMAAALALALPAGVITLWSGAVTAVPAGWSLCDGTGGTPDLRDRFVVGAGSTYAVGATGGAASTTLLTANLPSHTHAFSGTTASDGAHTHGITDPGHVHTVSSTPESSDDIDYINGGTPYLSGRATSSTVSSTTGITINSSGAHTHTVSGTTGATGDSTAIDNRPPYYALAYIMKV